MTRDVFGHNITVNAGVAVITSGWGVFATGTLTNNGTIKWDGSDGINSTGGAALGNANRFAGSGIDFGGGGAVEGAVGTSNQPALGGAGGGGGSSIPAAAIGGGGAVGLARPLHDMTTALLGHYWSGASIKIYGGGAGGGGGAGTKGLTGGGGGGGGGQVVIAARTLNNTSGTIQANGGAGATGRKSAADKDGGGAGGGGGGGLVVLLYDTLTAIGTVNVNGGAQGAHNYGFRHAASMASPGSIIDPVDRTAYSTASITPVSGTVYFVAIHTQMVGATPNVPAMSGTNGWNAAYSQVATITFNSDGTRNVNRLTVFAITAASSVAGVITAGTFGGTQIGCIADVRTFGTTMLGSVQATTKAGTATTTPTVTALAAFAGVQNFTLEYLANIVAAANVTAPANHVEATELNQAAGCGTLEVAYHILDDLTAFTWATTSSVYGSIAIEVSVTPDAEDAAAGSAGLVVQIPLA
jgi:hypothetical protein